MSIQTAIHTDSSVHSTRDLKFLEVRYVDGPNMWTYTPVLEAIVDIGELEDYPSDTIPGFYERLSSWLPSLFEHRCSYGEPGGFLRRVQEGTWPCHILEHVTLELQNLAGMRGGFGRARETSDRGVYKVVVSAWNREITLKALYLARELVLAAMGFDQTQPAYDVQNAISQLRDMIDSHWLGPSTACIVDAATARNIPSIRLLEKGNLVQLGQGAHSRYIWTAETDSTTAIAENISRDKELTKSLLRACGIPVPEGRIVTDPADAWEAAEDIGLPVVVKPDDGNHGRGVFIELSKREEIESAFAIAAQEGSDVLVERYIPGIEHRLLIVGGKLVAAARGDSVFVTGDGASAITKLIEDQINSDPRRGPSENHPLNLIRLDDAVQMELAHQGYTSDSVPPAGTRVQIQRNGNHAIDITDEVDPVTADLAALAARIVGLDIAGIDLVVEDISRPLAEQEGAIVEVNAGPSLLMHIKPAIGEPRPVGEAIVNQLFPNQDQGRIPVVGITGSSGMTVVARLVASLLILSGKRTGLACGNGLYLDHRKIDHGNCANHRSARRILMNRTVEAAVFENGFNTMLEEGLAYDSCQVGVVTRIEPEQYLGYQGTGTTEQVFKVLRTQVDVVSPTGGKKADISPEIVLPTGAAILNAEDPMQIQMTELCQGEVIYFSCDPGLAVISAHRQEGTGPTRGKRVVTVRNWEILLIDGPAETLLIRLDDLQARTGNFPVETAFLLAGIGAGWALGMSPDLIRTGLIAFLQNQAKQPSV
ncbi:cyanophycin synthetase [Nitrosomonas sp.]|uniref:cyanophycin synthetase n=1 Tax=Nitrosomonas sp. TaxID=42353 RepID=UPI0025D3A564|nr:cyanophycin synthetase [Nitrosomonas sp.]MCC6916266.1 cyanophycin synthetase [Nitrosomonas sp.]